MIANPMLWGGADPLDELGRINRSLRFRSGAAAYLSRTPSATGNRRTWTFNSWIKRGKLGVAGTLFGTNNPSGQAYSLLTFNAADQLYYLEGSTVPNNPHLANTTATFRDAAAHMNVHILFDSPQSDPALRLRVFASGVELAMSRAATMPRHFEGNIGTTQAMWLCANVLGLGGPAYCECNLSNTAFVDGVALPPSAFGHTHPITGQWRPLGKAVIKAVVDAGGAQSWFLPFDDITSLTTLCADASHFGNHWTANHISLTVGASYDSLLDTPTNNYATLSPAWRDAAHPPTLLDGNLRLQTSSNGNGATVATIGVTTGKWYWEVSPVSLGVGCYVAVVNERFDMAHQTGHDANGWGYHSSGQKYTQAGYSAYGAPFAAGDVVGTLLDMDAGTLTFYKNGVSQGVAYAGLVGMLFPAVADAGSGAVTLEVNFGQRPFAYPVAGARAICTKNLPLPTGAALSPRRHFDVLTRVGDGANPKTVAGLGFAPGLVWSKIRSASGSHQLYDIVRGSQCGLNSDSTNAEVVNPAHGGVQAFTADGFTMQGPSSNSNMNAAGAAYVDWLWRAGGAAVANSAGTLPSQVSANPTAGFAIITWTGTGAVGSVGHGLGQPPKMVIVFRRRAGASHAVWHAAFGSATDSDYLYLDMTHGKGGAGSGPYWNGSPPNAATVSLGTGVVVNAPGEKYVAYCFAEVPGFSKFGSYVGNGSPDGPFVYCGFRPAFVMVKRIDSTGNWETFDAVRSGYNGRNNWLLLNSSGSEGGATNIDMVSNGFKIRVGGSDTDLNISGATHIFAAFAEFSFRYANAR